MKINLSWINDYVKSGLTPEKLAHKLTMAGLEVEQTFSALGQTIFELEITPNRPDCLSHIGIAREISAIVNKPLTTPKVKTRKYPKNKVNIEINEKQACHQYIGTLIKEVNVKNSDKNIKQKIESLGNRSVNNVVDVTNFVLMESGQPLHAFDYDKIDGGKIIVRKAKKGEKMMGIDDVQYALDESILVIADAKKPIAIAGVMGGKETEVTHKTTNILLECAYFQPILIRRTSRKLALSTDSSYRFERGVDRSAVEEASKRACDLLLEHAGGKIVAHSNKVALKNTNKKPIVKISVNKINQRLGANISATQCKTILKRLECKVVASGKDTMTAVSPSFRGDINSDVDVIEEISRVIGYDNLPSSLPVIKANNFLSNEKRHIRNKLRNRLIACGLNEVVTFTMINRDMLNNAGLKNLKGTSIQNPLTQDQEIMRPSMLPSLLSVCQTNLNRRNLNLSMFEVGKVYSKGEEKEVLSVLLTGVSNNNWRDNSPKQVDFYDIKGIVDNNFESFGAITKWSQEKLNYFEEGKSFKFTYGKSGVGYVGAIDEDVLSNFGIKETNVWFATIELDPLLSKKQKETMFKPISEFPAVLRDVSIGVKKQIRFEQVKEKILKSGPVILSTINFKEEYLGEKIDKDSRGLVFSLTYQSQDRTLTEQEVNSAHQNILNCLVEELSAEIR